MVRRCVAGCMVLLAGVTACAQDMGTLFVNMPDTLSPLLTKVNREDFGDFLASGMKAEVKNRFGDKVEMVKLTEDYLLLKESAASSVEMKLLPLNDSVKVICCIYTCMAPVADSRVTFYSTQWEAMPSAPFLSLPVEEDFWEVKEGQEAEDYRNLRREADLLLMKASLSVVSDSLSFVYTTPDYMDKKSREKVQGYVKKQPMVYRWRQGRFCPEETEFLRKEVHPEDWKPRSLHDAKTEVK